MNSVSLSLSLWEYVATGLRVISLSKWTFGKPFFLSGRVILSSHLALETLGNLPLNLVNHSRTVFKLQMDLISMFLILVIFFKPRNLHVFKACTEGNVVNSLSMIRHV